MSSVHKIPAEKLKLIRRYLVWCYKTTKEDLDRIDRYFTQQVVDEVILDELQKNASVKNTALRAAYAKKVEDFKQYMTTKQNNALAKKFADVPAQVLQPDYLYLQARLKGVQRAIRHFLGAKELAAIEQLYEQEMTRRILEAREHT